jgi:hypothetical protein
MWPRRHNFKRRSFDRSKVVDVQTSGVDAKCSLWHFVRRHIYRVWTTLSSWDFKFSRRLIWSSESSGMYCHVLNWMSTSIKNTAVHPRRFWAWTSSSTTFLKTKNYEYGGLLKFKINILFYGDNLWAVRLRLGWYNKNDLHGYKFHKNNIFNGAFEYGDDGIFKILRWMQNCTSQRWTMKFWPVTDLQKMKNYSKQLL